MICFVQYLVYRRWDVVEVKVKADYPATEPLMLHNWKKKNPKALQEFKL